MTDSEITPILVAIGKVEVKVDSLLNNQEILFNRTSDLKHDLDRLQQAHEDQMNQGGCNQNNPIPQKTLWGTVLSILNAGAGIGGIVLLIITLILLRKYGII
jgi:hypothetical protein